MELLAELDINTVAAVKARVGAGGGAAQSAGGPLLTASTAGGDGREEGGDESVRHCEAGDGYMQYNCTVLRCAFLYDVLLQ